MKKLIYTTICILLASFETAANCTPCKCYKSSDKLNNADCARKNNVILNGIPTNLNASVNRIDFKGQTINYLKDNIFNEAKLTGLSVLSMEHCQVEFINKNALNNVARLVNINLAHNKIEEVHSLTFQPVKALEWISLRDNKIKRIERSLFSDLKYLQYLDVSENNIATIDNRAFFNNHNLTDLRINNNRLKTIDHVILANIGNLNSIRLYLNPWNCDCPLLEFQRYVLKINILGDMPVCESPENLKGLKWYGILSDDVNCMPEVRLMPSDGLIVVDGRSQVALSCEINSKISARAYWSYNRKYLDGEFNYEENTRVKSSNLNFHQFNGSNSGLYGCIAENSFGIHEQYISVIILENNATHSTYKFLQGKKTCENFNPLIISTIAAASIILLIITIVLVFLYRRKYINAKDKSKQYHEYEEVRRKSSEMHYERINDFNNFRCLSDTGEIITNCNNRNFLRCNPLFNMDNARTTIHNNVI